MSEEVVFVTVSQLLEALTDDDRVDEARIESTATWKKQRLTGVQSGGRTKLIVETNTSRHGLGGEGIPGGTHHLADLAVGDRERIYSVSVVHSAPWALVDIVRRVTG